MEGKTMMTSSRHESLRRGLAWTASLLAGGVGLWHGYSFGHRISGVLLGMTLAAIAAVLCALMVDDAVDRLLGWRRTDRESS
jgi:hypothetical protein